MSKFAACLQFTLLQEGGYQCAYEDAGNWTDGRVEGGSLVGTNRGISASLLLKHRRRMQGPGASIAAADMQTLTEAEAAAIYAADFAGPLLIEAQDLGIDLMLFDCAVEHGIAGAVEIAQRVTGAAIDGRMGPHTIEAIDAMGAQHFLAAFAAAFMAMLRSCSTWRQDGAGWSARADRRLAASRARCGLVDPAAT